MLGLLVACNGYNPAVMPAASSKLEMGNMQTDLEELHQALPDPFRYSEELEQFFMLPKAQAMVRDGRKSANALVQYIRRSGEPALVRVAALLLSQLDPDYFYADLLELIATANRETVEALEPGLWRVSVEKESLARDLIALVTPQRPYALLLLQRPAVRVVKASLIDLIRKDIHPLSTFAMYCFPYALDDSDRTFIADRERNSRVPEIRGIAREYLSHQQEP